MEKGNVDMELIRRYVRGELSPREMYALERQAQADPMLMDIIVGMEQETLDMHDGNLADIRGRIAKRTSQRRAVIRRLAPAQRWAIAASIVAVLTVGTWWFIREDTVEQREATVAATPKEIREMPEGKAEPLPEPIPPPAKEREIDAAPQAARIASADAAAAKRAEKKEERLARVSPKANVGTRSPDSTAVVGYGTQKKSVLTGAVARLAAKEKGTPIVIHDQALAGWTDGIRIRGTSRNAKPVVVSGMIVDGETNQPLPGVALELADGHTVVTDSSGRFIVNDSKFIPDPSLLGYELKSLKTIGEDTVLLVMESSMAPLDEVVVGYGGDTKTSKPVPKDGWDAYRQYLKDAMKLAQGQEGTVYLAFTVDDEGRPAAITVTETTNDKLNAFATLIVRDGPRWLPGANDDRKVTLRVVF